MCAGGSARLCVCPSASPAGPCGRGLYYPNQKGAFPIPESTEEKLALSWLFVFSFHGCLILTGLETRSVHFWIVLN